MRRIPRALALVLLGLGIAGSLALMMWIVVSRGSIPTPAEAAAMSPLRRGLAIIVYSRLGMPVAAALAVGAMVGGALLWLALKRKRWALGVVAVAALGSIGVVWGGRHVIKRMEDPRFANESRYVRAATDLAIGGTVYFAALGTCALAGFLLARERKQVSPEVSPPPSPAPSSG